MHHSRWKDIEQMISACLKIATARNLRESNASDPLPTVWCSCVRPSVCLSRSNIVSKWLNIFIYSSVPSTKNLSKILIGSPYAGALNADGEIFDQSLYRKRYKIGPLLKCNTNRNSYAISRTVPFSVTLNDPLTQVVSSARYKTGINKIFSTYGNIHSVSDFRCAIDELFFC